jgi:hypothetical protein
VTLNFFGDSPAREDHLADFADRELRFAEGVLDGKGLLSVSKDFVANNRDLAPCGFSGSDIGVDRSEMFTNPPLLSLHSLKKLIEIDCVLTSLKEAIKRNHGRKEMGVADNEEVLFEAAEGWPMLLLLRVIEHEPEGEVQKGICDRFPELQQKVPCAPPSRAHFESRLAAMYI